MEKVGLGNNSELRLPPGFRFHPTDEELVIQYLKRKVLAYPLPASIIPEADMCKSNPWDLPGDAEQERYFFCTREVKYPNGSRSNRATESGYWKATGLDKRIVSSRSNQIVGMKKTLVFYRGKPPKGNRTDWIMHEYRLSAATNENWVLCRIFLKKRSSKSHEEAVPTNGDGPSSPGRVFYDFMAKKCADLNQIPANSSSVSSGITEISKRNETDDYEDSSCNSSRRQQ